MSPVERISIRVGAVAFAAGLSLAGPQALGVAVADAPDGESSAAVGNSDGSADRSKQTKPSTPRAGHVGTRTPRSQNPADGSEAPQPRAGRRAAAAAAYPDQGRAVEPASFSDSVGPVPPPAADTPRRSNRQQPATSPAAAESAIESGQRATVAVPPEPADVIAQTPVTRLAAIPAVLGAAAVSPQDDQVEPPSVVSAPAHVIRDAVYRFFDSTAAWLAELPAGPGVDFLSGALLLVRRSFFNQAPIVTPVQTTGQDGGPITGVVGAVDPENDPLTYRLVQTPIYGDVTLNPDGTYIYHPGTDFHGDDVFTVAATDTGWHLNLVDLFRPASTVALADIDQGPDIHQLSFNFIYGVGAALWSQAARTALQWSAEALSTYFVVTSPVTVSLAITGLFTPAKTLPDGTIDNPALASAGSDLISKSPGFHNTVVQNKILTGVDANGAAADGRVRFNFWHKWAYGDSIGADQMDFESTAMHELLHAFGFTSEVNKAGSNNYQDWAIYDQYLVAKNNDSVIKDLKWDSAYDTSLTGGTVDGLYFAGPNAVAAYGKPVPVYTPKEWSGGSSVAHLDDDTFKEATGPNAKKLMNAADGDGPGIRYLSPVEIGILRDLGYTLT